MTDDQQIRQAIEAVIALRDRPVNTGGIPLKDDDRELGDHLATLCNLADRVVGQY